MTSDRSDIGEESSKNEITTRQRSTGISIKLSGWQKYREDTIVAKVKNTVEWMITFIHSFFHWIQVLCHISHFHGRRHSSRCPFPNLTSTTPSPFRSRRLYNGRLGPLGLYCKALPRDGGQAVHPEASLLTPVGGELPIYGLWFIIQGCNTWNSGLYTWLIEDKGLNRENS